jgi:hypothetical protein
LTLLLTRAALLTFLALLTFYSLYFSVVVDLLIAKAAGDANEIVRELEAQLKSPSSPLMQVRVTSVVKSVKTVSKVCLLVRELEAQLKSPSWSFMQVSKARSKVRSKVG